jgi:hypothetical protein
VLSASEVFSCTAVSALAMGKLQDTGPRVGRRQADRFWGRLWGAQTRSDSCRHAVFVDQPAEPITSSDLVTLGAGVVEVTARSPTERG